MHRSTHAPELIDAWLPPRVGRNARLERLTQLIDWAPRAALVADLHAAPVGRPSYPPLLMVKVLAYNLRRADRVLAGAPASP